MNSLRCLRFAQTPCAGFFFFLSLRSACALGSDFNSSSAGFSRIKICLSAPAFSCSLRVQGDAPLPSAKPACTQRRLVLTSSASIRFPASRKAQSLRCSSSSRQTRFAGLCREPWCAPAGFAPVRSAWCRSPGPARLRSAALPSVDSASASFLVSGGTHSVPCSAASPVLGRPSLLFRSASGTFSPSPASPEKKTPPLRSNPPAPPPNPASSPVLRATRAPQAPPGLPCGPSRPPDCSPALLTGVPSAVVLAAAGTALHFRSEIDSPFSCSSFLAQAANQSLSVRSAAGLCRLAFPFRPAPSPGIHSASPASPQNEFPPPRLRSTQFLSVGAVPLRSAPRLRHCFFVCCSGRAAASPRRFPPRPVASPGAVVSRPPSAAFVSVPPGECFHRVPRFQLPLRHSFFCCSGLPVHRLRRPALHGRQPSGRMIMPPSSRPAAVFLLCYISSWSLGKVTKGNSLVIFIKHGQLLSWSLMIPQACRWE